MKMTVMANGMVKVEGSTLAEEVEMRNKLQAQGKTCTPIEYEGTVQDCLDWIMGESESELDDIEDEDYDDDYEDEDDDYEDDDEDEDYEDEDEDEEPDFIDNEWDGDICYIVDRCGQTLPLNTFKILIKLKEDNPKRELGSYNWKEIYDFVTDYLRNRSEITEDDLNYMDDTDQIEHITDHVWWYEL